MYEKVARKRIHENAKALYWDPDYRQYNKIQLVQME